MYTVGHGTLSQTDLIELLCDAEVAQVVDVRSYPGGRHNPHHGNDSASEDRTNAAYR